MYNLNSLVRIALCTLFTCAMTVCIQGQVLFTTDFVYESPSISISPNGELMVFTEYRSKTGIMIRHTQSHEVKYRIGVISVDGNFAKVCYGFLNDSQIVALDFTDLVTYDIVSGLAVDSMLGAEFACMLTDSTLIARRGEAATSTFLEYNPGTGVERELFTGVWTDRFFTSTKSPFYIRTSLTEKARVYRKSDHSLVRTIDTYEADPFAPYAFSIDGMHVFAQISPLKLGYVNLISGAISEERDAAVVPGYKNQYYLSPDGERLAVVGPYVNSIIQLSTAQVTQVVSPAYSTFRALAWHADSKRFVLSSTYAVREHNTDIPSTSVLRALVLNKYRTYRTCAGEVIVAPLDIAPPFIVDTEKKDITHIYYPQQNLGYYPSITSRLHGSDTLLSVLPTQLQLLNFCKMPFDVSEIGFGFASDNNLSITSDKAHVIGLAQSRTSLQVVNTGSAQSRTVDVSRLGDIEFVRVTTNDSKIMVAGAEASILCDLATLEQVELCLLYTSPSPRD